MHSALCICSLIGVELHETSQGGPNPSDPKPSQPPIRSLLTGSRSQAKMKGREFLDGTRSGVPVPNPRPGAACGRMPPCLTGNQKRLREARGMGSNGYAGARNASAAP